LTESPQPTSGSLSAKIIRACRVHAQCELECPDRVVEDLGELATFDRRSVVARIKESYFQWHRSSQR
jgi:hypothetical protein